MSRAMIWPLAFGILGCAVLIALGSWQVQRLHWKADILHAMAARIHAAPVALPEAPDPVRDRYLAVRLSGTVTADEIAVMASRKGVGAGYRIVAAFEAEDGRRLMLDRGFVPAALRDTPRPVTPARVTGNLHWPDEQDSFTPAPDRAQRLWFARDVSGMAAELDTEPLLVVLRDSDAPAPGVVPMPLDTSGIPDNHLNYAITWFSLAAVWAGMTVFLLWRIRQKTA